MTKNRFNAWLGEDLFWCLGPLERLARSFQASMKIRIAWTRSATLVEAFQRRCQASSNDQASSAGRATTRL
jgi:hypothetical protein